MWTKLIIIFISLFFCGQSWAATCNWTGNTGSPNTFTSADVVQCVTDAAGKTGEVIIQLPTATSSGTWSAVDADMSAWTTPTKLTIQGNGKTNTIISVPNGVNPFNIIGNSVIPFRITGIKFSGANLASANYNIIISGAATGWRIDNCHFYRTKQYDDITVQTYPFSDGGGGLIDNNVFEDSSDEGINTQYASTAPADSWTDALTPGGVHAVYIENNTFTYTSNYSRAGKHAVNSTGGGRYVFRYNTLTYNDGSEFDTVIDSHGAATSSSPNDAGRWIEVYNNTLSGTSVGWGIFWRGGDGIVFDNTITSTDDNIRLGSDNMLEATCPNLTTCPYPNPGQMTIGYAWGNSAAPVIGSADHIPDYIQLDRDYTIPTTGTYANIPATCTHTVGSIHLGYWATDQNKLYTCSATNTWAEYYVPYTYPHPLTGEVEWLGSTYKIGAGGAFKLGVGGAIQIP